MAEKKAAAEQALHEKHETRVVEAERELQEAVKKSETLEQSLSLKEPKLVQPLQTTNDAQEEAQAALKDIQEARKIAAGKGFLIQSNLYAIVGKIHGDPLNLDFSRGVCGSATQHI